MHFVITTRRIFLTRHTLLCAASPHFHPPFHHFKLFTNLTLQIDFCSDTPTHVSWVFWCKNCCLYCIVHSQWHPIVTGGRRKKEEASSSGGETDLTMFAGPVNPSQSVSPLIPVNGNSPNFSKILTGREIMTVMRRKGEATNSDPSVDATGESESVGASPSPVMSLKPDSTVPSPDICVETNVRPSLSPMTITQSADTSTHCTSMETDVVESSVKFQTTAVSTTPSTNENQWKMTTHCTSMETNVTASPVQFQTSAVSSIPSANQWTMKKEVEVGSPQKGFSCRECSQWFAHTAMLAQHQLMHAGKIHKDATTLECIADIISMATMGQVVDQKPMET